MSIEYTQIFILLCPLALLRIGYAAVDVHVLFLLLTSLQPNLR